jgi:hypothetical protein
LRHKLLEAGIVALGWIVAEFCFHVLDDTIHGRSAHGVKHARLAKYVAQRTATVAAAVATAKTVNNLPGIVYMHCLVHHPKNIWKNNESAVGVKKKQITNFCRNLRRTPRLEKWPQTEQEKP